MSLKMFLSFPLTIYWPLHSPIQASMIKIGDILSMPYNDILDLTYTTDDQGDEVPLGKGDKYRLRIIKYYHLHRTTAEDWLTLTHWEEYQEYRVSKDYDSTLKDSQMSGANHSSSSSTSQWTCDPIA
jgi:hypothetical protein